jgi:hypothetical protein
MSRKNDYSAFQGTGPRIRSHAQDKDTEDSRQVRNDQPSGGRPRDGRSRNEDSRFLASNSLSNDDINEQIRSFFAKDLV